MDVLQILTLIRPCIYKYLYYKYILLPLDISEFKSVISRVNSILIDIII